MLEKLGDVIKKATNKIANAIFLDKNMVEGIIRDLQRALIEADVNIMLIKELSDKIKKAAFDERIQEIEKKEHIIKLLHDELLKILGEYKPLTLGKQDTIILLGLYGAGKCVHRKSNIQLSNGEIIRAEDLYDKYLQNSNEENLEDGTIIDISNKNLFVPSFNPKTLKIENKKATHLWRLKKDNLIEIKLDNGNDYSIKVTPEHPFFVLKNGRVIQIRADELTENDFLSVPNEIEIIGKTINLFEQIKNLNLFVYLTPKEAKDLVLRKYTTIKEAHKKLRYKKNYCQFTKNIKEGKIPIQFLGKKEYNFLRLKGHNEKKIISFPLFLTTDLSEFIGYVIGDGYINKSYIEITTQDSEIINRIQTLSKSLFNIDSRLKKDKRGKSLYQLQLISKTLVNIFKIFGLTPGKKGRDLKVPKQIFLSSNEIVRAFIKAYFDCDSYPAKNKRFIELVSESKIMIQQINILLRRFGILSTISKKIINNISYWRLYIKARYAETYSKKISYLIENKQEKVKKYGQMGRIQGVGNQDMIPLGKTLKALRLMLGFSIGEIQESVVHSYGIYEQKGFISREQLRKLLLYYKLKKKGFFLKFLEDISNGIQIYDKYGYRVVNGVISHLKKEELIQRDQNQINLSQKGQQQLQLIQKNNSQDLLEILLPLSQSNICWIPTKEINRIKNNSEFVYDLTVEDNHSFLAEGLIVHNTTTIAKLGNYYAKRGKKVAVIGLDVHRPGAPEQLQQLGEKHKLKYFVDLEEKDALKIWKKYEKELKEYNLILVDTAGRHNLDKELSKEIKDLAKKIKPTQSILVMPADIGQAAKKQAQEFKEAVNISGVIITRMDSTAKAGGALTACAETQAPVYFIGTGEKINDLEEFNPEAFLSRLLGMGDLQALIEKIRSVTGETAQEAMQKKLEEGHISLTDVIEQVKSMGDIGGFDKIKGMIPGMGNAKIPDNLMETQERKIKKWEHILKSMTPEERDNPEILKKQTSRITRVAQGAGVHNSDIRSLLKQYDLLNDMIGGGMGDLDPSKGFSEKQMKKLAKKFGKMKKVKF